MFCHFDRLGDLAVHMNCVGLAVAVGRRGDNLHIIITGLNGYLTDACNLSRGGKRFRRNGNGFHILIDNQIVLKRLIVKCRGKAHIRNREVLQVRVRIGRRGALRIRCILRRHILIYRNLEDNRTFLILACRPHSTGLIGRGLNVRHVLMCIKRKCVVTGHVELLII